MAEAHSEPHAGAETGAHAGAGSGPAAPSGPGTARRRRRLWFWLLPVLLVGGWYGGKAAVRRYVDSLIEGAVGLPLPHFSLQDRNGAVWTPASLRGEPAVLHFFRSRCASCDREAPAYRRFELAVARNRANILHVCTDVVLGYPADETRRTIEREQFERPVVLADEAFVDAFHTVSWSHVTPVTYVVDSGGTIRLALRGAQDYPELMAALASVR